MKKFNSLFVFDIETVPDYDVVHSLTGETSENKDELSESLKQYHLALTSGTSSFPRLPFHKIVAISFLEANITHHGTTEAFDLVSLRTGGTVDSTEIELLTGLNKLLDRKRPRLVSYNGRGFDLPVIKYRSMKHGVSAGWFYNSGDKWNNYTQRFSPDWHCDLNDSLCDYGASGRVKMNEVCATLELPGKTGVDGSQVETLYNDGNIKEIRNYCECDVLNTYLIYLKYMMHRGVLTHANYKKSIKQVVDMLECSQSKDIDNHLQVFDVWKNTVTVKE